MKFPLLLGAMLCCTTMTLGQGDFPFVVDGVVHVDHSCHIQLKPDANGKAKQKKIDGLCRITKYKDVYAESSVLSNGMPRVGQVELIEMEYTLANPTKGQLKFELTYRFDKGFRYDPNSGQPPDKELKDSVVFDQVLAPGQVMQIDLAERK